MQADGYSLDDKRTPLVKVESGKAKVERKELHRLNNIPDILDKWRKWKAGRLSPSDLQLRTSQCFLVPQAEIVGNDYDLSINRYKEVEYEAVQHDSPQVILQRLATLEDPIVAGQRKMEEMLKSGK